jgi:hypothetical protein
MDWVFQLLVSRRAGAAALFFAPVELSVYAQHGAGDHQSDSDIEQPLGPAAIVHLREDDQDSN